MDPGSSDKEPRPKPSPTLAFEDEGLGVYCSSFSGVGGGGSSGCGMERGGDMISRARGDVGFWRDDPLVNGELGRFRGEVGRGVGSGEGDVRPWPSSECVGVGDRDLVCGEPGSSDEPSRSRSSES